jgi:DNA-binding response OmpR family regulator
LIFTITPHHTEPNAYFDADKIDKIIFNLLSNAFKYTPEGGKIDIDLAIERKDGHAFLMIRIKDNGTGIPADEIDKIFIQFYNNKNAGKNESNGIGLALTKDLIELHHGYIYVESEVNKGTCFTIQIPIDRESYQQNELKNINEIVFDNDLSLETSAPEIYTEEEELHTSEKLNLLLVEDNEDLLATVKSILSKSYHVLTASNGKEALRTLQGTEIDLIISDIMMPEMDGLEFCRTLKADVDHSHIPIILLTAKNSVNDRVECYNSGADAYISKPFDLKVLDARINSFILNKRIRQTGFKTSFEINIAKLDYPTLDEKFLNNAIKIIEDNLNESDFEVVSLADKLNMSKSTLYRKVKILLGLSPSELIKNIRLKHACQMMSKDKSISVSEVAFSTGFSDPRYFATCFKAEFGLTPTEYQKQNT